MKAILCLLTALTITISANTLRADSVLPGHEKVASALKELEKNTGYVQERLGNTLTSLGSLQGGGDLKSPYGDFSRNLEKLQSLSATVDKNSEQLNEALTANYSSWQAQIDQIQDSSLKSISAKRLADEQKKFATLAKNIKAAQTQLAPVIKQLSDINGVLKADLTAAGVKSLEKPLQKASKDGNAVLATYDKLKQDFQQARQSISSTAN
ncbi:MAG: DUF2959 domain-containing protein [Verrucomicrobiales bacterium]|jgi:ABC-type transporter Mla subunit MlaD|nr:DUF2959 domain-containing protein [Verrucomicrobiales bacterium]